MWQNWANCISITLAFGASPSSTQTTGRPSACWTKKCVRRSGLASMRKSPKALKIHLGATIQRTLGVLLSRSLALTTYRDPMADFWRRKEVQLERGARVKPSGKNLGEAPGATPAPRPPGHQNFAGAASSGWGSGGAQPRIPGTPSAPGQGKNANTKARKQAAAKAAAAKAQPDNKGQGKGKRKGTIPDNFAGCFYCKGPHFLNDCAKWIAAGRPPVEGAKRQKKSDK